MFDASPPRGIQPGQYLTPPAACDFLTTLGFPTTWRTLAKLRSVGGGPAFVKFSERKVAYSRKALEDWVASKFSGEVRSTSELPGSHVKRAGPGRPQKRVGRPRQPNYAEDERCSIPDALSASTCGEVPKTLRDHITPTPSEISRATELRDAAVARP
jgi:hypothetical protein